MCRSSVPPYLYDMPVIRVDRGWRVADIVTAYPECARVLVEQRIDFCFRGDRTLEAACIERGIDVESVLPSLTRAATRGGQPALDPTALSTPELISFILSRHHAYLFSAFPFVETLVLSCLSDHRGDDPTLRALHDQLGRFARKVRAHLYEEEAVLFPALRADPPVRSKIVSELVNMHEEHLEVGAELATLRRLTNDYTAHEGARSSYRRLMRAMAELELDTVRHIHVETYVLMRRVAGAAGSGPPTS